MVKNLDKNMQKSTVSKETGLTPIQEKACILLASGCTVMEVAERLSLNRGTLYKWQNQTPFKCFFNKQCADIKGNMVRGLLGLADDAVKTIRESLNSANDAVRLKAAFWIVERVGCMEVGHTNVVEALKAESTHSFFTEDMTSKFDEEEFRKKMELWGGEDDEV